MPISSDSAPGERERHPAVLRLTGVAAGYGGAAIVSGVNISVGPGEVVSVIGPNGAGKSTLLKAVTGRLPVMAGTVTFKDTDVTNWRGHRLARMGLGFVPQTKDVFDTLTVTENLEMGGYLLTKSQLAARIDKVMSTFPALANMRSRTASKLSGGERKMLAVARVLMVEPPVLVLDEPTSNLSPELSRSVLQDQVRRLAPQHVHLKRDLDRAQVQLVVPPGPIQGSQLLFARLLGVQQGRHDDDRPGPEPRLLHPEADLADRDRVGQRVVRRPVHRADRRRLVPDDEVVVLA